MTNAMTIHQTNAYLIELPTHVVRTLVGYFDSEAILFSHLVSSVDRVVKGDDIACMLAFQLSRRLHDEATRAAWGVWYATVAEVARTQGKKVGAPCV